MKLHEMKLQDTKVNQLTVFRTQKNNLFVGSRFFSCPL